MTGKELKAYALKVSDESEILVEVEDVLIGPNFRRKFVIHALVNQPPTPPTVPA